MNQFEIPISFQGAQLRDFGKEFIVTQVETPKLNEGEVLVKVEAASVNPYDLEVQEGHYQIGITLPAIIGVEGSGVIVQIEQSVTNFKVGQRVAFLSSCQFGSYGQYAVASTGFVIPLDDKNTFEEGAYALGNPATVLVMVDEVKSKGAKAVVQTAAASALGRMFFKLLQKEGIPIINIVRREEQEQLLKREGAQYILNQSSPTFFEDLQKLSHELNVTAFFDAIGGVITGQILKVLPNNSTAYTYGILSGQNITDISVTDLMSKNKNIQGFSLFNQLHKFNPFKDSQQTINELLKTIFKTEYAKEFKLEEINQGIQFYKEQQTSRKILIRPNQ